MLPFFSVTNLDPNMISDAANKDVCSSMFDFPRNSPCILCRIAVSYPTRTWRARLTAGQLHSPSSMAWFGAAARQGPSSGWGSRGGRAVPILLLDLVLVEGSCTNPLFRESREGLRGRHSSMRWLLWREDIFTHRWPTIPLALQSCG